jgi:hypothetical protein
MRTMDLSVIWEYGVWFSGSILYFPFFMESFVIGFAIVEFHQLLSKKKRKQILIIRGVSDINLFVFL